MTETEIQEEPYWEFDADGCLPKPPLRECPLCPGGGQPYFTRTVNGTNMIYVGCSQCGLELKAALIMVAPTKEQPSKDILAIWNTRAIIADTALREQLAQAQEEIRGIRRGHPEWAAAWDKLQSRLAQVEKERDRYAEALESATRGIKCDD